MCKDSRGAFRDEKKLAEVNWNTRLNRKRRGGSLFLCGSEVRHISPLLIMFFLSLKAQRASLDDTRPEWGIQKQVTTTVGRYL